jgi:hypothetical protein
MRKFAAVAAVLLFSFSIAVADEFIAVVKKVDGNKVTILKGKKDDAKEVTLTAADNVKVLKGKFNKEDKKIEAGDPIEEGLKNKMFASEKGVFARITTSDDGKITQILVMGGKGGKKKQDK